MFKKKEVNVLLIGGSGHGKSFFLNTFEQVAVYRDFDHAVRSPTDREFVIPLKFFHEEQWITEGIKDADQLSGAKSLTSIPTIYEYPSNYGILRFIDTPGIGDTSGSHVDKEHLDAIISCMNRFEQIHGILLFFKKSDNRLDFKAKYQLCELLSFLGKSAVNNIHFVVTHVGPHNDIGDVGGVIGDFIRVLPEQIPFTSDNIFHFENDPLKYIVLRRQGRSRYSLASVSIFGFTYENTREEYVRLFKTIANCRNPYDIREYRSLAAARQLWPNLSLQLSTVDAVRDIILRSIEENLDTKALLKALAEMELNLNKTKSVFESAVETILWLAGGTSATGLATGLLARGVATFAGSTAAGAAIADAISLPAAAAAGAAVGVISAPALIVGAVVGAFATAGLLTVNHIRTKKKREQMEKEIEEAKIAVAKDKSWLAYECFKNENEQMKELEKDFARCLRHNAILSYTLAKEEYVKTEMTYVKSDAEKQVLKAEQERLLKEKEIFEQILDENVDERPLLSPEQLVHKVEAMCELQYYGEPMKKALERYKAKDAVQFDVIVREELALGWIFHEIFENST